MFRIQEFQDDECILIIKPTRCTNFSILFLEQNSTCFGHLLCPSSGVFHSSHSSGICQAVCEQDQDGTAVPPWSCSQAVSKPVWHVPLPCVQWKTADDGQRNRPKHVEFCFKNKFEKLFHLVGFIVRIYHDARSPERQMMNVALKILFCGNSFLSCWSNIVTWIHVALDIVAFL
jgi:hypothetical protein